MGGGCLGIGCRWWTALSLRTFDFGMGVLIWFRDSMMLGCEVSS